MINVLVFSSAFIFSITLFINSYSINGAKRVVDSYGLSHAQNAISIAKDEKEPPFFLEKEFVAITERYFQANLPRYLGSNGDWHIDYIFDDLAMEKYLEKDMFFDKGPQTAIFTITIDFNEFDRLVRTKSFIIKEGRAYGW